MAPPTPLECSGDGCGYSTPPGAPNWEIISNLLTAHTQAVHNFGGQQTTPSSKLEKLPDQYLL